MFSLQGQLVLLDGCKQLSVFFLRDCVVLFDAGYDFRKRGSPQTYVTRYIQHQLLDIATIQPPLMLIVLPKRMFRHEVIDVQIGIIPAIAKKRVDEIVVSLVLKLEV